MTDVTVRAFRLTQDSNQPAKIQLTLLVPIYNEAQTIESVVDSLRGLPLSKQIILIDDGSTDETPKILSSLVSEDDTTQVLLPTNSGKGAALKAAQSHIRGEITLVQDADLEYDPADIPKLIKPILDGKADVVYGSRFHGDSQRVHLFWHRVANWSLTLVSNAVNNLNLSDMETGYKAFRSEVFKNLQLMEKRFGIEPEITAKIARMKCRIYEVPISYSGRDYSEGKKIRFKDALRALYCIFRYRFFD